MTGNERSDKHSDSAEQPIPKVPWKQALKGDECPKLLPSTFGSKPFRTKNWIRH